MGRFRTDRTFQTKEEFIFETLRAAILRCELEPGEKLVVDRLSEELGVSPIPVRTALQRLEVEGLVEIVPFTGAIVTRITVQEIDEIFLILEALERAAFEAAASRVAGGQVTARQVEGLRGLVDGMAEAMDAENSETWTDLNARFHLSVAEIAGMKLLSEFTRRAFDRWGRLRRWFFRGKLSGRSSAAQQEHVEMIAMLSAGRSRDLAELAAAHNRAARVVYSGLSAEGIAPKREK
jgi:DNA-binding GntR family transcriptional regulator